MEAGGADPGTMGSVSRISRWNHEAPPATGAGGVGEGRETVDGGVVAVKQVWRRGEPILARSARSRVLAAGTMKPHLLREQGVWERTEKTVDVDIVAVKQAWRRGEPILV